MSEPLFCYCLEIAGREFLIEVSHEGVTYWDDYQMRRRLRNPAERHLEIGAFIGDARARRRLAAEIDEFTVAVKLSPALFARFREAARLLADGRWSADHEQDLDQFLIPMFWSDIDPHLINPLSEPSRKRQPGSP
jgi:hypothetical protein